MPVVFNRLNAKQVREAKKAGKLNDGGGLSLQVTKTGTKSWLFTYRWMNKRPEIGLGPYPAVSLADARRKAEEARGYLAETPKRSPREVWAELEADQRGVTFGEFAETFMARILGSFKNDKHRYQWPQSIAAYAKPILDMPINQVDTPDVLKCLQPIWTTKNETAKRLRGRIERILDAAKAEGLREGENPARWRNHLQASLPAVKQDVEHFAAMPYSDLPAFMQELSANNSASAPVLMFGILTGARATEARAALWSEIDLDKKIWTLPPVRMKGFKEHVVPLSEPALAVLIAAKEFRRSEYVFPGQRLDRPLSETSIRKLLKRLYPQLVGGRSVTTHGFRSTFRDWTGDKTSFSYEIAERSVAHLVGSRVSQAYRRGNALEKRRELMDAWARFCTSNGADIVRLHG